MTIHDRPQHPEASVYEGREGFLRFTESDWAAFEGSAVDIEESIVNVWRVRAGKCVELRNYSTMEEALAALR